MSKMCCDNCGMEVEEQSLSETDEGLLCEDCMWEPDEGDEDEDE